MATENLSFLMLNYLIYQYYYIFYHFYHNKILKIFKIAERLEATKENIYKNVHNKEIRMKSDFPFLT